MIEAEIPASKIRQLAQAGQPHLRPIYAAMAEGVGLALVQQGAGPFPTPKKRPFVGIVGDDTDRSLGPDGFHRMSIERLAGVSHGVVLMACALMPNVYATAAFAARMGISTLIIETRPEHEAEWLALIQKAAPAARLLICTVAEGTA